MVSSAKSMVKANCSRTPASSSVKKVNRRDPEKRKEQNRQSQKTYREKQKRRIEELERLAAQAPGSPPPAASASGSALPAQLPDASDPSIEPLDTPQAPAAGLGSEQIGDNVHPRDVIDPSLLAQLASPEPVQRPSSPQAGIATAPLPSTGLILAHRTTDPDFLFLSSEFDRWLQETQYTFPSPSPPPVRQQSPLPSSSVKMSGPWSGAPGSCSCPGVHTCLPIRLPSSFRPSVPASPCIYSNTLRIDMWCVLSAILENCLHLGVSKAMFCAEDSQSPFYRISTTEKVTVEESQVLVKRVRSIHGAIKYDLRPIDSQILKGHHPYIDVLPFRDLRQNLISYQYDIDEDEFLLDFLNNATCWGGVRDAGAGTGCPWESRSWEANEQFLRKWWVVVGGEDGELTRTSRWWREMRGERVAEVF